MGPRSMLTVVSGLTMSVAVVVLFDRFMSTSEVPLSTTFAIFWALALLYAIGSRFFDALPVRAYAERQAALRVAIYGRGSSPVRACRRTAGRTGL